MAVSGSFTDLPHWTRVTARHWELGDIWAKYLGDDHKAGASAGVLVAPDSHALIRGSVRATVRMEPTSPESQARIVFARDVDGNYVAAGLGGHNSSYVLETYDSEQNQLRKLKVKGLPPDEWPATQTLTVKIAGRHARLVVNGSRVLEAELPHPISLEHQIGLSAWGPAPATFEDIQLDTQRALIFVVMQFRGYEDFYEQVLKRIEKPLPVRVKRVDEVLKGGRILGDIENLLQNADLVIADISELNPNVYFEFGYAFALKKSVLLCAKEERKDELPFDVRGERCYFYEDSPEGREGAIDEIVKRVKASLFDTD